MRSIRCVFVVGLLLAAQSQAASVIETREGPEATRSIMTVQGHLARMQSEPQQYVLVDTRQHSYLSVDLAAKRIIDMAALPPRPAGAPVKKQRPVMAKLVRVGPGPSIAGFPTEHYQLIAAARICSNTFLSKAALEAAQMKEFMTGFSEFVAQQKSAYIDLGADYDPCQYAEQVAMARYPVLGMPLKTVDVDGFLRQEVVRIATDVPVPAGFFEAPAGLKTISMEQLLRQDIEDDKAVEELLRQPPPAAEH